MMDNQIKHEMGTLDFRFLEGLLTGNEGIWAIASLRISMVRFRI